jgi:hypothetical protein
VFPHFDAVVAGVPDYDRFPRQSELEASTDGLAAAGAAEVWTAGRSRAGRPIRCLEIAGGPLQAMLVGLPHPEEPVGALVLQYLLPLLAGGLAEELGFGFSVVMAGDPDGLVLNEPWFDRPYDLTDYLLCVYRPPLADQFEWTFPVEYKRYGFLRPLPEARAVMEVVHRRPLDLYMGLHDSTFCGGYFYLAGADAELEADLAATLEATALPAHCGEPEVPYLRTLSPGVFRAFSLAEDYDFYEAYGADPAALLTCGTSSDAYAEATWDCFTLVAEAPHFTTSRIADLRPAGVSRGEAKLDGLDETRKLADWLHGRYVEAAARLTAESPWQRTVHAYLVSGVEDLRAERAQISSEPRFREEATVAQFCDSLYLRQLEALTRVGQFANMVAAEPVQDDVLARMRAEAEALVRDRAPRLASACGLEAVPLRRLVQCQLSALLSTLVAVRDRYRPARPRPKAAGTPRP